MAIGLMHRSRRLSRMSWMAGSGLLAVFLMVVGGRAFALNPSMQQSQYILDHWELADGLPQSSALTITRTPDGYLWIGTQEGLARFDGVRFVVFDRNNEPALASNEILVLYADRAGRLWIGTQDGLTVLQNGQFKSYDAVTGLAHVRIQTIIEDSEHRLWVGTDKGLVEVDHGSGRVFGTSDGLRDAGIRALLEDRSGMIWVATATGGLYRYDGRGS
jgi:ligand-binding sensor domain-containing protein